MSQGEDTILARKVRGPKMRVSGFPAMEPLCNTFASIMATMSRKKLRSGIDVTVYGYEVVRHGEYLRQLRAPSAIFLIAFPDSDGTGLIKAHPRLLGKVLDLSLGGDGGFEDSGAARALTQIDLSIYGRFVDIACQAFDESIHELCVRSAIGPGHKTRFEDQPGMIRIAPDRAEIFVIKLNFHIGDDKRGAGMDFVVPISTLEPLKRDLSNMVTGSESSQAMWENYMRAKVMELPLGAEGIIDLGAYSVGELTRLEQGELIELPPGAIDEVELRIETTEGPAVLTRGRLGAKGRFKALRLAEDPDEQFLLPLVNLKDET